MDIIGKVMEFFRPSLPKLNRFAVLDFEETAKLNGLTGAKWLQFTIYTRRDDGLQASRIMGYTPAIEASLRRKGIPIFIVPNNRSLPLELSEAQDGGTTSVSGTMVTEKPFVIE